MTLEQQVHALEMRVRKLEKLSHVPVTFIKDENGYLKVKERRETKAFGHRVSQEAVDDIHKMKGAKMPANPHRKINETEDQETQ